MEWNGWNVDGHSTIAGKKEIIMKFTVIYKNLRITPNVSIQNLSFNTRFVI